MDSKLNSEIVKNKMLFESFLKEDINIDKSNNKNLPEICVTLKDGCGKKLSYPNNLGKRTKLGGTPDWIQDDETPKCNKCGKKMSFVSQIDSIGYNEKNENRKKYMFGDVGMLYLFFCFKCEETKSILQSY